MHIVQLEVTSHVYSVSCHQSIRQSVSMAAVRTSEKSRNYSVLKNITFQKLNLLLSSGERLGDIYHVGSIRKRSSD
jgi:hypothetical protein